jgi:hypothetical protein
MFSLTPPSMAFLARGLGNHRTLPVPRDVHIRPIHDGKAAASADRLVRYARGALATFAPTHAVGERRFVAGARNCLVLGARLPLGRCIPGKSELVRLAIAAGTGLRLRSIGPLSVIAIDFPRPLETVS